MLPRGNSIKSVSVDLLSVKGGRNGREFPKCFTVTCFLGVKDKKVLDTNPLSAQVSLRWFSYGEL